MASEVEAFLENGDLNSENFFVDEDVAAVENGINLSVGGIFTFTITLTSPFDVVVKAVGKSKALKKFNAKMADTPGKNITERLQQATKTYLAISDELDEENSMEGEDEEDPYGNGGGGDAMDQLSAQTMNEAAAEARRKEIEMNAAFEKIKQQFDVEGMNKATIDRILADYNKILQRGKSDGWKAQPNGRDLSTWNITLFDFEKKTALKEDMDKMASQRNCKPEIDMVMKFPKDYPFNPPFIRVIRPRFAFRTGHVTMGGSICTELLTEEGWRPIFDVESIIEMINAQIRAPESKGRIDLDNKADYSESEAIEAFHRMVAYHKQNGW